MKKKLFLLAISSFSLFVRAMDDKRRIVTTPAVFRLKGEKLIIEGFKLNQKRFDETKKKFDDMLMGVRALASKVNLPEESIKPLAERGNLRAALVFAANNLRSTNGDEQNKAYAFLEKSLALDDHPWRTPEQSRAMLDKISESIAYMVLRDREQAGDSRASYVLGDIMFLKARLGLKAGIFYDSSVEPMLFNFGVGHYQKALSGDQLSEQQRERARRKCGAMRIALISHDNTMPFVQARNLLEIESMFGVPGANRSLAAFLIARGDDKDKKKGYQMLEARIAVGDSSVTSEDVMKLGQWYVCDHQEVKAVELLLPLADTELSPDAPEQERVAVASAALLVGQELTHGVKAKKIKRKKTKNSTDIESDYERARYYITKSLALGINESGLFCLASLLFKEGKKEQAQEQFKKFIAAVDVDVCKREKKENILDAYCQAQVSMLCFELQEDHHEMIGHRIGEIFRVYMHSHKLNSLYTSTNIVPNVFDQQTQQIMRAGRRTPQELDLCYLFGRLCCEAKKSEAHGLECLQYAADNEHAYAQWFLGVAAINKLIARGNGSSVLRVQQAERYLVSALCSGTVQETSASQMLHTVVDEYARGGSLRMLFARAMLADRDSKLEDYLASLSLKVEQGNVFDTLDLSFVQEPQPPEIETVLAKVKLFAEQKESTGACILAGRLLVAESTRDKTDPGEFDLEKLQNGVRLLEKAQKVSLGDVAARFYLGHALHKMAVVHLRKQQPEGYTYLMRAITECNNQRTKTSAALLLFAEQDQKLKGMLNPIAHRDKTTVENMALEWCQKGWQQQRDIDGVIALAIYWMRKKQFDQALRWLKEAKKAGVKEFWGDKDIDKEIAVMQELSKLKGKKGKKIIIRQRPQ